MKSHFTRLLTLGLIVSAFLVVRPVHAITLIPPTLEYGVKPGESISTKVKLFNEQATDIVLYESVDNFIAGDEDGTPKFTETPTEDLASWIQISSDAIVIRAGEKVEIPVEIKVPANADPGGHYGALFFGSQPLNTEGQSAIAIGSKIAALIILRVDGTTLESGKLTSFVAANGKTMFTHPPISLVARFGNDGNVHVRPTGTVTIRNMLGGTTTTLRVNATQGAVLPKTFRQFKVDWVKSMGVEEAASTKHGGFFTELKDEWGNFAVGPYTADIVLTYGLANDKTASATLKFWIMPWQLLLTSLVVIILVILLIVFAVKRYNRWILARAQSTPKQP